MSAQPPSQRFSSSSLASSSAHPGLPPKPVSSRLSSATSLSFSSAYNGSGTPSVAGSSTTVVGGYGQGASSSGGQSILDRPLNKTKGAEVSLGAFAFLLAEIIGYSQGRVDSVNDLERRLSSLGYETGLRILSLIMLRNTQQAGGKDPKREHRLIPILQFVHTQVYKYCFGKPADGLERSVEGEDEYMLTMNQPPLTQHISIPKDMSQLSCEAFTAGIVEGVLDGLDVPARVTAHTMPTDQFPQRTVVLIKLDQQVMDREEVLAGK